MSTLKERLERAAVESMKKAMENFDAYCEDREEHRSHFQPSPVVEAIPGFGPTELAKELAQAATELSKKK